MPKKNKKEIKKKNLPILSNWFLIIGVVSLVLIINLISGDKILSMEEIIKKVNPTLTPTPTRIILDIVTPSALLPKDKYLELAKSDLTKKLNIDSKNVKVISVEPYDFSDTSLGCPQKGKIYAPAVTSGFIIKLEVLNKTYIYHAGLGKVISCRN
jgi:hypothetical protein